MAGWWRRTFGGQGQAERQPVVFLLLRTSRANMVYGMRLPPGQLQMRPEVHPELPRGEGGSLLPRRLGTSLFVIPA